MLEDDADTYIDFTNVQYIGHTSSSGLVYLSDNATCTHAMQVRMRTDAHCAVGPAWQHNRHRQ